MKTNEHQNTPFFPVREFPLDMIKLSLPFSRAFAILMVVALGAVNINAAGQAASPSSTISSTIPISPAAKWLTRQMDVNSSRLYVYSDFSDSRNAFTQRGAMGDGGEPVLDESSTVAYSGITSIKATVPIAIGTWSGMAFGNGILEKGSNVPQMDWGNHDASMDLTGAKKLVIHARADDGQTACVGFKMGIMGGEGTEYPDSTGPDGMPPGNGLVTLTDQWQTFNIDLSGADLSKIAAGFVFTVNDSNWPKSSVSVYFDDIYYDFGAPRNIPLFLASYSSVPLEKTDSFINSYAYSYDAAMSVLALSYSGKKRQAAQVADALLFALYNDRQFPPDQRGIRNGYASGSPISPPGWYAGATGKAPYAKLAGTYDKTENTWKEDYYSDSYSTGNNAWILIAFLRVYRDTGKTEYLKAARDLAAYLETLRDDTRSGYGGFTGGWEGFDTEQKNPTYASTEHNIDLYSAFSQIANIVAPDDPDAAEQYKADADHARSFVRQMYNADEGFFYAGTGTDGNINKEFYPLDTNAWGIQSHIALDAPDIDSAKVMAYIENNLRDPESKFFKFSDKTTAGYWAEGTYQKIVADLVMGRLGNYRQQLDLIAGHAEPDGSIRATNVDNMATGLYLDNGDPWLYQPRVSLAATSWKALAELGVNPLDPKLYSPGHDDAFTHITIAFDPQGGVVSPATTTVILNTAYGPLPVPELTRDGYDFAGWWTGKNGAGDQITAATIVHADATTQTLYANWTATVVPPPPAPQNITITFDPQDGTLDTLSLTATVTQGQPYGALPAPTREGYDFADWWTGKNGAGDQITAATIVPSDATDQTLYANWTATVVPPPPPPPPPPVTPVLTVNKIMLSLDQPAASTDTFDITSNVDWTTHIDPATSGTWLAVIRDSGSGNCNNAATTITDNTIGESRTASIVVAGGGITRTLIATQAATNIPPDPGPATLSVSSTLSLTLADPDDPDAPSESRTLTIAAGNKLTITDAHGAATLAYEYTATGATATLIIADRDSVYLLKFTNATTGALTLYTIDDDDNPCEFIGAFTYTPSAAPLYALTVINGFINGSSAGSYEANASVHITANTPPAGQTFEHWTTTAGGAFADVNSATTTFTMPESDTTIKATYKDTGGTGGGGGSSGGGGGGGSGGGGGGGGGAPSLFYLAAAAALLGARAACPREKTSTRKGTSKSEKAKAGQGSESE